eukprot:m.235061 g.235061  ORF g.235061 m.235061 type:complete len:381 (-) comp19891_c0_seq1:710-1852(-)
MTLVIKTPSVETEKTLKPPTYSTRNKGPRHSINRHTVTNSLQKTQTEIFVCLCPTTHTRIQPHSTHPTHTHKTRTSSINIDVGQQRLILRQILSLWRKVAASSADGGQTQRNSKQKGSHDETSQARAGSGIEGIAKLILPGLDKGIRHNGALLNNHDGQVVAAGPHPPCCIQPLPRRDVRVELEALVGAQGDAGPGIHIVLGHRRVVALQPRHIGQVSGVGAEEERVGDKEGRTDGIGDVDDALRTIRIKHTRQGIKRRVGEQLRIKSVSGSVHVAESRVGCVLQSGRAKEGLGEELQGVGRARHKERALGAVDGVSLAGESGSIGTARTVAPKVKAARIAVPHGETPRVGRVGGNTGDVGGGLGLEREKLISQHERLVE